MEIRELYDRIGGNFDEAKKRMMKEEWVSKYACLFLKDKSFSDLKEAMQKDDMEAAFNAAHTLKGVCANLSFDALYKLANVITEDLRHQDDVEDAKRVFKDLENQYDITVAAIEEYSN